MKRVFQRALQEKYAGIRNNNDNFEKFCQVIKQKDRQLLNKEMWLNSIPWTLAFMILTFPILENLALTVIFGGFTFIGFKILYDKLLEKEFESCGRSMTAKSIIAANEFILVLDSTHSLQDACELIASGKYGIITAVFQDAIRDANYGSLLQHAIIKNLKKSTFGKAEELLLKIVQTWSESPESISIMADHVISLAESQLVEQNEKINTMASIQGIGAAFPPVLTALLLISGLFSIYSSIIMCILLYILLRFNSASQIYDEDWEQSSRSFGQWGRSTIISTFAEQLRNHNNYFTALFGVLNRFVNKNQAETRATINSIAYGIPKPLNGIIDEQYSKDMDDRTIEYLRMAKRFSEIDPKKAATHLMRFSNKLQKIEAIIAQKNAKIRAERARLQVLQTFSTISLSLIAAISPVLIIVAMVTSHPLGSIPAQTFTLQQHLFVLLQIFLIHILSVRSTVEFFPKSQNEKEKIIKMVRYIVLFFLSLIIGEILFYKTLGRISLTFS